MDIFLGFDFGTTSIKASAIDSEGKIIANAKVTCQMTTPKPGYFEIDAKTQWESGFLKALELLGKENVARTNSICISSVCASFVPMDQQGKPVRNAILYGIDTRAIKQVERLNSSYSPKKLANIVGSSFTSHSILPKILWLKENEPSAYKKTAYFVESSNFITSLLTGDLAWDRPTAAGGHMIHLEHGTYPTEFLKEVNIDASKLPPLMDPLDILGKVTAEASKMTGIPENATVLVGACDVNAEAFGCGAFDPGSLLLVYGSTISTLFTIDSFKKLPGFLTGPSVLKNTYRIGGATSSGGRYLDWVKETLNISETPILQDINIAGKVIMLPYLDGARIPYQKPLMRVLWYGMTSETNRQELWKAAFEAMGYELSVLLEHLLKVGEIPASAHVMGGLASNRQFLQVIANITGLAQQHFLNISAAFGDAMMALSSVNGIEEVRKILQTRRRKEKDIEIIEPDMKIWQLYEENRSVFRKLTQSMINNFEN